MSNSTSSKLVDSVRRAKDPKVSDDKPEEKKVEQPKAESAPETNSEKPRRVFSSSRTWPD